MVDMTYPAHIPWKPIAIISLVATCSAVTLMTPLYFWFTAGKSHHSSWMLELLLLAGVSLTIPVNIYELKKKFEKREEGFTSDIWKGGFYHGLKVFAISGFATSCLLGPLGALGGPVVLLFLTPFFFIPWTIAGAISLSYLNDLIMNHDDNGENE